MATRKLCGAAGAANDLRTIAPPTAATGADEMKIAMWVYLLSAVTCLSQAFMQIIIPQYLEDCEKRDSSRERHNDWYSPTLTWGQVLENVLWSLAPVVNTIGVVMLTFEWCRKKLDKPVVPKDAP